MNAAEALMKSKERSTLEQRILTDVERDKLAEALL